MPSPGSRLACLRELQEPGPEQLSPSCGTPGCTAGSPAASIPTLPTQSCWSSAASCDRRLTKMLAFLSHHQALIFHDALTLKMQLIRKAVKMQHFINASHCAMLVTQCRVCHKDPISDSPEPHARQSCAHLDFQLQHCSTVRNALRNKTEGNSANEIPDDDRKKWLLDYCVNRCSLCPLLHVAQNLFLPLSS